MLIRAPVSVNDIVTKTKKSNSHLGCKNEQQADFEVQLENKITIAGH